MRKSSVKPSLQNYFDWLQVFSKTLNCVYELPNTTIMREYKQEIFEAFVAKIWTQWEILAEDMIIDCLNKDTTQYAEYVGLILPKHITRVQCELMLRGIKYFEVQSVEELRKTAKRILTVKNNPFSSITAHQIKKLEEFRLLRNYICHYSWQAERSLFNVYETTYKLKRFPQPGPFLMASVGKQKKNRLNSYIDVFIETGKTLANALGIDYTNLMQRA